MDARDPEPLSSDELVEKVKALLEQFAEDQEADKQAKLEADLNRKNPSSDGLRYIPAPEKKVDPPRD